MSRTRKGRWRRRAGVIAAGAMLFEAAALWLRTRRVGGDVIVRGRAGHLFTTIWIPAVSVKALRLGWWRVQRCPVGRHWSLVTPVKEGELSEDERRFAHEHRDIRV